MESRMSIVCLGVRDFARSYQFYSDLGFRTTAKPTDPIAFFSAGGIVLSIFPLDQLAADIGPDVPVPQPGFGGITLAHNTRTKDEVDHVMAQAEIVGAKIVKPPHETDWGGYSGYFTDPDGYYWEVAHGAMWKFDERGCLILE